MSKKFSKIQERAVRAIVEKRMEKEKGLASFFESDEFNEAIGKIKSQRIVAYGTSPCHGLSEDTFNKVFESIYHVLENQAIDNPSEFEKSSIDYKGIRFYLLIGQGASYSAERID